MVRVIGGICDIPSACKNTYCPYYDVSAKATKRYLEIEDEIEEQELVEELGETVGGKKHRVLEFTCPFLRWKEGRQSKASLERFVAERPRSK